jgi:hypothetical protein
MPHHEYEPQSVLENFNYTLHYDRSITSDQTTHNNRLNMVMLNKTIKEAYSTNAAILTAPSPRRPKSTQT